MTAASTEPEATSARAWEYLAVTVIAAGFEEATGVEGYHGALNGYGRQGWELVEVAGTPGGTVERSIVVLFLK